MYTRIVTTLKTMLLAARYATGFCWKHNKSGTIARLIVSVLATVLAYLTVQAIGQIINAVQLASEKNERPTTFNEFLTGDLAQTLLYLISVLLAGIVIGRFAWFFKSRSNQRLRHANQQEFNKHRATLDVAMFRSRKYDDLTRRIQELPMSWNTRITFSEEILTLVTTLISFVLFGASLLLISPSYAAILLIAALPMMISEFKFVSIWWTMFEKLVPHHKKRHMYEKVFNCPSTFVQGLMFGQMPSIHQSIKKNVDEIITEYDEVRFKCIKKELYSHAVSTIALCAILVHAVWGTLSLGTGIGTLTVLIASARTFQGNLESIVALVAAHWNSAKGVILIQEDFLGLKPLLVTEDPIRPVFNGPPRIRFERVSFAYPGTDTLALKEVSFTIEPATVTAIVGPSGSGKSSLASLLTREYDPTSGTICADTIDLRNIHPTEWVKYITALTQEFTIRERTIAQEIASSRLDDPFDMDMVVDACRFAHFEEVVESDPKGYDSQIGIEFGGRNFSGGEKQRLALARARYRNAPILVLDEPDAKLDPKSAELVMKHVFALKGVTVVIITHHVSRAEPCDQIIMMGKGEIAEMGTHEELIACKGTYAKMFELDKKRLSR